MKITILSIGKSQPDFIVKGIQIYLKKIQPMSSVEWNEIVIKKKVQTAQETQKLEETALLKAIDKNDYVILLDEKGKDFKSSRDFASFIEKLQMQGHKTVVFIIGGAFGFSDVIYERANAKISLSPLTFSHQMIRLIFLEQLYRGFSIINNLPYHND